MVNEGLIPFTKTWKQLDGSYAEKIYWFNPLATITGLEPCTVNKGGSTLNCTKIFYGEKYVTLIGSVEEFYDTCRKAKAVICILSDLYKEGITLKSFIKSIEEHKGQEL